MSNEIADARRRLQDALADVYGVSEAHAYPPDVIVAGSAWPSWVQVDTETYSQCGSFEVEWHIFVALPAANLQTTLAAADKIAPELLNALTTVGDVTFIEPASVAVAADGKAYPALRATLTMMTEERS